MPQYGNFRLFFLSRTSESKNSRRLVSQMQSVFVQFANLSLLLERWTLFPEPVHCPFPGLCSKQTVRRQTFYKAAKLDSRWGMLKNVTILKQYCNTVPILSSAVLFFRSLKLDFSNKFFEDLSCPEKKCGKMKGKTISTKCCYFNKASQQVFAYSFKKEKHR